MLNSITTLRLSFYPFTVTSNAGERSDLRIRHSLGSNFISTQRSFKRRTVKFGHFYNTTVNVTINGKKNGAVRDE